MSLNVLTIKLMSDIFKKPQIVTKGGVTIVHGYGKILIDLRQRKSREKVAKDIGISPSALGMYELELRTPRDEVKIKLANYYGKSVQDIFFTNQCH